MANVRLGRKQAPRDSPACKATVKNNNHGQRTKQMDKHDFSVEAMTGGRPKLRKLLVGHKQAVSAANFIACEN